MNCRELRFALVIILGWAAAALGQTVNVGSDPEIVAIATKDGAQLALTYYKSPIRPGTPEAKQVTPVVLLHDHLESRAAYASLAQRLQFRGDEPEPGPAFAVIAVDLRGHGDSTKQILPNGAQQAMDAGRLHDRAGIAAMITLDMEAVRSWLVTKNDEGAFNLNKLCLVGAGMGATVATNWAAQDWAAPPLAVVKQGQDVKALALISPRWSYRGVTMQAPMAQAALKQNAAWLIISGAEDADVMADVRRLNSQLVRFHPETKTPGATGLRVIGWPSGLQGGKLLAQHGVDIEKQIVAFLTQHVATLELPWISRRDRLP
jgi:pimeloyl-ACP methyl ester carboxylesterase